MLTRSFLFCLVLVVYTEVVYSQTDIYTETICNRLKNTDCDTHNKSEVCGTDNITYRNRCEIGKAYCAKDVHQAHLGKCTNDPNVTRSPEEVQHGSDIAYTFECLRVMKITCGPPDPNEKCCGTDGYTYPNFCEFSKAKCTHRDLHIKNIGDC